MAGQWKYNKLKNAPQRIRPETHWFRETRPRHRASGEEYGRVDGSLWFSLQLRPDRAKELYEWNLNGVFGELIGAGARMAPTSRKALKFVLDRQKFGTIGTDVLVPKKAFAALEALPRDGIEISDAGLAVEGQISDLRSADNGGAKSTPGPIPKGSPIIIATIDDGIGIANHRFRASEEKTRIKHFLDLALIGNPTPGNGGVDELLGRSWKGADIENLLGQDEEQVYRALGLIDPLRDLRQPLRAALTHGTHVLDLAAGYDWRTESEIANSRPIIAVQLPSQVAENLSDTWLAQCLKRALDWILVKADELSAEWPGGNSRRLPLVVNGSFASMAGPQDGLSDVERRITQFIKTYRGDGPEDLCTIVLSAGNSLQLRDTARMDIPYGDVGEIPWRLLPDDKTPNFVQIWLPKVDDVCDPKKPQQKKRQQVEVSLIPPRDAPAKELASKLYEAVQWKIGEDILARIYHQSCRRPDGSRECITIATRPTADDQESEPVALVPSGLWQIKIKNIGQRELRNIDLQAHRNDVGIFSRSGARQSYFDDPGYVMFDPRSGRIINNEAKDPTRGTRVTRQGTLSSYAYAKGVLAVGGYRRSDGEPAEYSSSGRQNDCTNGPDLAAVSNESSAPAGSSSGNDAHIRTRDADQKPLDGPDLAAVSEESPAITGVLAAGTYSGSVAILAGTSVAAPQVTRALADRIATRVIIGGPNGPITTGQESAAAELKREVADAEKAKAAPQSLIPGHGQVESYRPLRDGVGRLPFTFKSSYPERTGG